MIKQRTFGRSARTGLAPASSADATLPRTVDTLDWATLLASIVLPFMAALSVAIWLVLLRWYDLDDKYRIAYFAFEKIPGQFNSPTLRRTLWLFLAVSALYAIGLFALVRARRITGAVKLGALAFMGGPGIVNIFLYPAGALDVFNYMVDLKLAYHYHANPYVVTNPDYLKADPFVKSAFMLHVPLFYGPAWLLFSGIPALFTGFREVVPLLMSLKTFNLVLLGLTALLIAKAQPTERRRWIAPFLFLANPLVVFEGVGNAHNDVMMTVFMVAALVAMRQPRAGWTSAPALALSALVKLFTGVLAPLFVLEALQRRWPVRRMAIAAVATVAVVIATAAPFWDGGDLWTGFRAGMRESQRMDHVSLLSLAQQELKQERVESSPRFHYLAIYASSDVVPQSQQDRLHHRFTAVFAVAALLIILARAKRLISLERASLLTLICFSQLMTNFYPWYLIPIVALLALELDAVGIAYALVAAALGLAYYPAYVWAHFNTDKSLYQVHLFLALLLTAPMLAFVAIELFRISRTGYSRWLRTRPAVSLEQ